MTEVTEWNGKPRLMWCWDGNEEHKHQEFVVCILTEKEMKKVGTSYPVCCRNNAYKHCAEIKEETKRLTWYELNQLLKCFGVECTDNNTYIYNNDVLYEHNNNNDKEVFVNYKIRYKQGEWEEPTRETVWKWWGEETPDSDIARFVSFIGWDEE